LSGNEKDENADPSSKKKETHQDDEQKPVCPEQYHRLLLEVSILVTG
jgi:hypothetical protein